MRMAGDRHLLDNYIAWMDSQGRLEDNIAKVIIDTKIDDAIEERANSGADRGELVCAITDGTDKSENIQWMCDTGATCHVTKDGWLLDNVRPSNRTFSMADGSVLVARCVGSYVGRSVEGVEYRLNEVYFVPNFSHNIISGLQLAVIYERHFRRSKSVTKIFRNHFRSIAHEQVVAQTCTP